MNGSKSTTLIFLLENYLFTTWTIELRHWRHSSSNHHQPLFTFKTCSKNIRIQRAQDSTLRTIVHIKITYTNRPWYYLLKTTPKWWRNKRLSDAIFKNSSQILRYAYDIDVIEGAHRTLPTLVKEEKLPIRSSPDMRVVVSDNNISVEVKG